MKKVIEYSINNPKRVTWMMVIGMLVFAAFMPLMKIDTDPENMLSEHEGVRVKHDELKEKFNMYDMLVVGIVNDQHPQGVFNVASLTEVFELSKYAYDLRNKKTDGTYEGVVQRDLMCPTNVDFIEPQGEGVLKFDWLMTTPPATDQEALQLKDRMMNNELFYNTLVSEDGKAMALYIPMTSKDQSYTIAGKIKEKLETFNGANEYHITGLPVAEDTFGIEMFIQMAISAPAAMLLIFILMMLFFKKLRLVLSPLIVAMVSVIATMGLLIATGNTVHIMSSMIPIFIMPIAVLDSVHILSEFYDRYQVTGDRRATITHVMQELFRPMLFTSLTSAAGFASLALTPIPPVQVFGIFVGFGILLAWFLTMTFIPAYIMMTSEASLASFGAKVAEHKHSFLGRMLASAQKLTFGRPVLITLALLGLTALAGIGIAKININDNPVKWFTPSHPIRIADQELNSHFGGTYMAYLHLESNQEQTFDVDNLKKEISARFATPSDSAYYQEATDILTNTEVPKGDNAYQMLSEALLDHAYTYEDNDNAFEYFEDIADYVALQEISATQVFKRPEVLQYMLDMEAYLYKEGGVGKSSSIAKMVRYINKQLHEGEDEHHVIPDDLGSVGQCLVSYQNSHIPEFLNHFVTPDYKAANLWLQLKSGDNKDMEKTIAAVDLYMQKNPPPAGITKDWYGLTYINVIWQQKMVAGMTEAFLGSFVIVFIMMIFLFRSVIWATLSMIPLTLTIVIIYGIIGWIGKDYDMPVAVLSSLALGLAIDFAIHFLVRARAGLRESGDWASTSLMMFGEPGNAIVRNMIVIAIGFLPLLLASLIPYRTVGMILAAILFLSGVITLLLLPSLIKIFKLKK